MKNRDLNSFAKCASVEELYALERAARLERSREMAKLVRQAFDFVARVFEGKGQKGLRHA